jgi:hypothetical protein
VPLSVGALAGIAVAAIPVLFTALLALDSNRPEIDFISAGRGSLHPVHLMTLVFGDLYGANSPEVDYWAPPSVAWAAAWGPTDLFLAQNMGQLYLGALPIVALLAVGIVRGLAWDREIRFVTVAIVLVLLYALGRYTPAFHLMYDLLPGVALYRRPADATFVLCALIAFLGGYLVHRFVSGTVPPAAQWQVWLGLAIAALLAVVAVAIAVAVDQLDVAVLPVATGLVFAAAAVAVLVWARRLNQRSPALAALLLLAFTAADLAWNNAPNESTGSLPKDYEALRPNTTNATVALLRAQLARTAAPDRRDRVELVGIAYHWPNLSLVHGFDHLFGHNPLRLKSFAAATGVGDTVAVPDQRRFSPLFPSYRSTMADLFGVRFIATGVPIEQIDRSLRPDDLNFIARTNDAYVYENPRALPRVLMVRRWSRADFANLMATGWPGADPTRTVLLERAPPGAGALPPDGPAGTARIVHYGNTDITIDADSPDGAFLVLNDVWHPWWRADVDGRPQEILKANVLFRAVTVPRGRHQVHFSFHPFTGALSELIAKVHKG